jgi:hypothetical protein
VLLGSRRLSAYHWALSSSCESTSGLHSSAELMISANHVLPDPPAASRAISAGGPLYPSRVTASEPDERPASAEREARQRERESRRRPQGMVPGRERRRTKVERGAMRLIATGGIIGIAVLLGAILGGQDVAGWIVGLVVGLTSVILAALLWSSRQL